MTLRTYLLMFFTLIMLSCHKKREKPNFIFLFADDLAPEAIHALGNNEIKTPALDQLAQDGISFNYTYNMGAWHGAVCVASRTMLNTGRSLFNAQAIENDLPTSEQRMQMWPVLLDSAGYETYFTGKWHVNTDVEGLFHHVGTITSGYCYRISPASER